MSGNVEIAQIKPQTSVRRSFLAEALNTVPHLAYLGKCCSLEMCGTMSAPSSEASSAAGYRLPVLSVTLKCCRFLLVGYWNKPRLDPFGMMPPCNTRTRPCSLQPNGITCAGASFAWPLRLSGPWCLCSHRNIAEQEAVKSESTNLTEHCSYTAAVQCLWAMLNVHKAASLFIFGICSHCTLFVVLRSNSVIPPGFSARWWSSLLISLCFVW